MFGDLTKAVVKHLGSKAELIANKNLTQKYEMLTLVKVAKDSILPIVTYIILDRTLLNLLEVNYTPEYEDEVLFENFRTLTASCGEGSVSAHVPHSMASIGAAVMVDSVDGASSFSLKEKTVNVTKLRDACRDKKLKERELEDLRLKKGQKLAVLYKKVYNTGSVDVIDYGAKGWSIMAKLEKCFNSKSTGSKVNKTSFTVPPDTTFAYGLMEITVNNGILGIPPREIKQRKTGWGVLHSDGSGKKLQQVKQGIKKKTSLLKPLAGLPKSTCRDLLKILSKLLDDRDALTLLEQTLELGGKGVFERPQSEDVASFMDHLGVQIDQVDAAYLLVRAIGALPDGIPEILLKCSEELEVLNIMVSRLIETEEVSLPEPLPASLQEEGELHWLADILRLDDETLDNLREEWDEEELPLEVLLELLCLVLQGLRWMQH